jgi:hypothetical protein
MIKKTLIVLAALFLGTVTASWIVGSAILFEDPAPKNPVTTPRPDIAGPSSANSAQAHAQILFGDLHVHTSYSVDAALTDNPASKGTPYTTPGDACDFARHCSALDFWSINDHAEGLTPWQWRATKEAVRSCNAVTDAANPDMVSFLGWEWSHVTEDGDPANHYGHKNVVFRDTEEGQVPTRPISSSGTFRDPSQLPATVRGLAWLAMSELNLAGYQSLAKHIQTLGEMDDCANGDVRKLPDDCFEIAATPNQLFEKLDQWGFEALVIPHGMAWGNTNPPGVDFNYQMDQLNEKYQRLLEVYSGHGNSEVYRDFNIPTQLDTVCPQPQNGYTPCCWQAGEIIRQRCSGNGNDSEECELRAASTRDLYLSNMGLHSQLSLAHDVVPETEPNDWGLCDQLVGDFQPSFYYQPKQSAQYMLTLGEEENRFRPGLIGSSDNHSARPGSSYKEQQRLYFTDVKEHLDSSLAEPKPASRQDEPVQPSSLRMFPDSEDMSNAFYSTGGLVAVHSEDRTREAIWDALYNRKVYGTSGPRIGLWFELIDRNSESHPMGSEVSSNTAPQFLVRAMGSIKQNPGCPDYAVQALGADRISSLCRNECYNPSGEAHSIERIELVRVLPRLSRGEKPAELIQDPWRVFNCEAGSTTCEASFTDESFVEAGREAVYYARVIQEATPTIQGDPLACEYNEVGVCVKTNYCMGDGAEEDCLSPAEHRAWSSPIFVNYQ